MLSRLSLAEFQHGFRRALLHGDDTVLAPLVADDALAPAARIEVYRNNVLSSLTAILKNTYPVVCRLVDERFFDYAADVFVRAHPPDQPCLDEYGERFAAFLVAFPPSRDLGYLPDVARLEWLMQRAALAREHPPLSPSALSQVAPSAAPRLVLHLQPSANYLASPWPIDQVWRANQLDTDSGVDLQSGPARIELSRRAGVVVMQRQDAGVFALRAALAQQMPLARATDAALAADLAFDAAAALARLFADGAVIAFALAEEAR